MDPSKTVMHTLRSGSNTKIFRITTQSSVYILGIMDLRGRSFAVLLGQPGSSNADVAMRDSDPQIGDRSLWTVASEDWVGHSLTVATLTTSTIRAVVRDESAAAAALVRTTQSAPAPSPSTTRATAIVTGQRAAADEARESPPLVYPETHVDYAEHAAAVLRALLRRPTLFEDVAYDSVLSRRLSVALADCALSLERLAREKR